jgi:hypothetical protein
LENIVASLDRVKNEVLVLITRFSNHEQRLQQLEDIANISKIPARQLTPLEHNISLELDQGVNPLPTRDSIDKEFDLVNKDTPNDLSKASSKYESLTPSTAEPVSAPEQTLKSIDQILNNSTSAPRNPTAGFPNVVSSSSLSPNASPFIPNNDNSGPVQREELASALNSIDNIKDQINNLCASFNVGGKNSSQ